MLSNSITQLAVYFILVTAVSVPLGLYMARVFSNERTFLDPVLSPIERLIYRICGINPGVEMGWAGYAISMLAFSLISMIFLYALQRLQYYLPLNPQGLAGVPPGLAFNTAASFTTNTNWQAYSGEQTLSYLTQMVGLTSHNFLSAAAGIAMAVAVIRGFARRSSKTIGNFWVDLTRTTLWVLLPLSLVFALVLVWQGVPDNFSPYVNATTLEGTSQSIAEGPVASQEIIKELGTNGGGFMNANSAHPYENPTPLTNLLEMLAIFSIGAGLTHTFGKMVGDRKQGWALFSVMAILFLAAPRPQSGQSNTAIRNSPGWESISMPPPRKAAATWRARRRVSESSSPRCGRLPPPTPRAAPSTRCTTAIRRWAGWCRWSICSSAR